MTASAETTTVRALAERNDPYAVDVAGLEVRIGSIPVVRKLSMHVPRGSIYGLIGPSGAGKTTLLRTLATVQQAYAGTARLETIDLRANRAAARGRIGYLPDSFGIYEDLTVGEYLDFYGAIYDVPARRRRQSVEELLELMGLARARDQAVKSLSRGTRQQLGLARCLIHDPDVLMLDEPTAGLDPRSRLDLHEILLELARFGKTILVCSHVLSELTGVCTHFGIMQAGEIVAEGEAEEIMRAVAPDPLLRVGVLDTGDLDAAQRILEGVSAAKSIDVRDESTLIVRFAGSRQDQATILAQLWRTGVRVSEFSLERPTLEEVFLEITGVQAEP